MKRLTRLFCIVSFAIGGGQCHETTSPGLLAATGPTGVGRDSSWALVPFVKLDSVNPILRPGKSTFICPIRRQSTSWEEKDVFNPAIVCRHDTLFMLYRAQDKVGKPYGTSRIGLGVSTDGIHFIRNPQPVLYPANDAEKKYEWEGGCEDPRVVEDELGRYFMTYTAFDGHIPRLMIASSADLLHWTKYGPAFVRAYDGKYVNSWSKSGSIVSRYDSSKIKAVRIAGKYWMYWGDQNIWLASSDDLISWIPLEMKPGEKPLVPLKGEALQLPNLKIIVAPRPGKFDSDLVECGPPAMLTDRGILLIYNSRNSRRSGDSTLAAGTYAASQVLISKEDPSLVLQRLDGYFIKPDKSYELVGQVNRVCFVEGLARFKHAWWLYYGTADSKIAVAVNH